MRPGAESQEGRRALIGPGMSGIWRKAPGPPSTA